MARRVIIHAGQHKTGSTSIQHYLTRHHAALAERGVAVCPAWRGDLSGPDPAARTCNAGAIAHAVLRGALMTPGRLREKYPVLGARLRDDGLRRVNSFLHAVPEETVVLSSEAFSFAREDEEFEWIESLCAGLSWRAVMFLREPGAWRDSWRRQVTHAGLDQRPGAVAGEGIFDFGDASWLTDHDAIRRFWRGRCAFLSYEEGLARDSSVFPAFIRALGLDPDDCPSTEEFRYNVSALKASRGR